MQRPSAGNVIGIDLVLPFQVALALKRFCDGSWLTLLSAWRLMFFFLLFSLFQVSQYISGNTNTLKNLRWLVVSVVEIVMRLVLWCWPRTRLGVGMALWPAGLHIKSCRRCDLLLPFYIHELTSLFQNALASPSCFRFCSKNENVNLDVCLFLLGYHYQNTSATRPHKIPVQIAARDFLWFQFLLARTESNPVMIPWESRLKPHFYILL